MDFHGLPPVLSGSAAFDRRRSHAESLGLNLAEAHVPYRYVLCHGTQHDRLGMVAGVKVTAHAVFDAADRLRAYGALWSKI